MTVLDRSICEVCGRIRFQRGGRVMVEAARTSAGDSPADDFLVGLQNKRSGLDYVAAVAMRFEDLARTGGLEVSRELNELRDGLYEIKAEKVRLPFFWVENRCAQPVARLTHGFMKGTWRTPRKEIYKATWIRREDSTS